MVGSSGIRLTYREPLSRSLKRELKFKLWGTGGVEIISTKLRSRQSSWRNGYVWLNLIEKEGVCSDVVTSEIVWFGFGGKTKPTVERQNGRGNEGQNGW